MTLTLSNGSWLPLSVLISKSVTKIKQGHHYQMSLQYIQNINFRVGKLKQSVTAGLSFDRCWAGVTTIKMSTKRALHFFMIYDRCPGFILLLTFISLHNYVLVYSNCSGQ